MFGIGYDPDSGKRGHVIADELAEHGKGCDERSLICWLSQLILDLIVKYHTHNTLTNTHTNNI